MTLIAAENRELALSISINQRNPKPEPEGPGTGYYLALTFGTLLSSQRADVQELRPRGLHSRRLLVVHRTTVSSPQGAARRPTKGLARRREKVTSVGVPVSNRCGRDPRHLFGTGPTPAGHTPGEPGQRVRWTPAIDRF